VVLGVLAIYAVWRVIHLAWTCDDAFISYRYAKHLVEGQGLVFNPGERVEGITNPLFTLLLAGMMAAGWNRVRLDGVGSRRLCRRRGDAGVVVVS